MSPAPLRVLHIGKFYRPHRGGIERVVENLVQALRAYCDPRVLCFSSDRTTRTDLVDGVLVERIARLESLFSVPIAPGMATWLRNRRFDVVHLHTPNPLAELVYLLVRPPGKLVVGYHAEPQKAAGLRRLYAPVARRVLERADAIAVATPHHFGPGTTLAAYRDRCHVIPYGIDLERYAPRDPDPEADAWRQRMGGPFALFLGRLVRYKGLLPLLEAVRGTEIRLAVAGSGPLFANLQQLRAGMEDRVQVLGDVPEEELPALLRACRCLVLPSLDASEAFGMVQVEAFAAGRPSVATQLETGVSWVNRHGETGLLVPPGDAGALRGALQELLADPVRADELGQAALARARETFGREAFGERTFQLYRSLTGAESGAGPG